VSEAGRSGSNAQDNRKGQQMAIGPVPKLTAHQATAVGCEASLSAAEAKGYADLESRPAA
jgi:hypothetical protein